MLKIEELNRSHSRNGFDCGVSELNNFLRSLARQNLKKGLSRTFVLVDNKVPEEILGFYTLSIFEIIARKLPIKFSKKYKGQLPAVKLARMGVAKMRQKQSLGKYMLIDAMKRVVTISQNAGIIGFFVDAKNESAGDYYLNFGFISLPDHKQELFLPLATLYQMYSKVLG